MLTFISLSAHPMLMKRTQHLEYQSDWYISVEECVRRRSLQLYNNRLARSSLPNSSCSPCSAWLVGLFFMFLETYLNHIALISINIPYLLVVRYILSSVTILCKQYHAACTTHFTGRNLPKIFSLHLNLLQSSKYLLIPNRPPKTQLPST